MDHGRRYVAGLRVNGASRSASWLDASFVRHGGRLDFTMSATPGAWGTGAADVPPSFTDGAEARNNVGTTPDGQGNLGSLNLSDWSLSRSGLTGGHVHLASAAPGTPDNWIPHGQRVDLPDQRASTVSFPGLATKGPSAGTVLNSDGTTSR